MPAPTRLVLLGLACLLLAGWAGTSTAVASPTQVSIMMDDDNLLYRGDAVRDATMTRMKHLGVDVVRVTVLWSVVADRARATKARRRTFRAANPRTYPKFNWDRYDRLVRAAQTLELGVYFNLTPPAPGWARRKAPRGLRSAVKRAWKPEAGEFAKFVEAVGRRYEGRYRDENDGRQRLPRVSIWSLLNEPNQAGWLAPQWERGRLHSAVMARELYLRGRSALRRSGHDKDTIFVGETAPLGSTGRTSRSPVYPKRWLRAFLCSSRRGPGCRLFRKYGPIRATGFAHHPYTKNVAPTTRHRSRDALTMANIGELGSLLDGLARKTRNIPRDLPLWMTEYGFETNPPDRFSGVALERQAEWNVLGEWLAFRDPRIAGIAQFLLRDVPPVRGVRRDSKARWFTYQSGLEFADGRAKPAKNAYFFPFLVRQNGAELDLWGQLKFRPNGLPPATDRVQLEHSADGGRTWAPVGEHLPVDGWRGFFGARVASPGPGLLRATMPGAFLTSLPQPVR